MSDPRPFATLLDLDGTVVDSEDVGWQAVCQALDDAHGIRLDPANPLKFNGRSEADFFRDVLAARGITDTRPAREAYSRAYLPLVSGLPLLPGVRTALEMLAFRGPVIIVTGSTAAQAMAVVDTHSLGGLISGVVACDDYPQGKPAPAPFLVGAGRAGLAPGDCLAIEDSDPGVASARAAGVPVVAVRAGNPPGRYGLHDADVVLDTLEELDAGVISRVTAR